MSRLVWGTVGQRFYEAGADRGVLFMDGLGVSWNGLKTVTESPTGGEPKPFYLDGIKYLNLSESEEFEGTIEAFSAPVEFSACDGELSLYAGLSITQQPRKSFGLSYRTLVGNDVSALDFGYKIHIVYNALAQPSQRARATVSSAIDPLSLSWPFSTTPMDVALSRPTAHLVIDSRTTPSDKLIAVEDILYGTDVTISRLPLPEELITIFSSEDSDLIFTDMGDGTFTGTGSGITTDGDTFSVSDDSITDNGDGTYTTT